MASQVASWKRQLHRKSLSAQEAARLHILLAEYLLAHDQAPDTALSHFHLAQRLTKVSDRLHGLAVYDSVIATYYQGAYRQAAEGFQHLLVAKPRLSGFDRRTCALWARHAGACAGYHAERAKLGIPEPLRLDPLCGAAALAAYLRANGLPYDKKHVLSVCRVTQEGSSLQDVLNAAKRMGLVAKTVIADDQGLQALPLPAVSYVEHDHFISVVHADKQGVSYLCSDCGSWPGGRIDLTWKQWHSLDPGLYGVVCKPGSALDAVLSQLAMQKTNTPAQVQLAALRPQGLKAELDLLSLLKGHVLLAPPTTANCGYPPTALPCKPHMIHCPCDCPPQSQTPPTDPSTGLPLCQGGLSSNCITRAPKQSQKERGVVASRLQKQPVRLIASNSAPTSGDPVDLANLEEEYRPSPDLTVYNPIGPSVVWSREYDSLRGLDPTYEYDDLGMGWTHPYNVGVYDPGIQVNPQIRQGAAASFNYDSTDAPASGLVWDILDTGGNTVATSSATHSWSVSFSSGSFTVTVPSSATVEDHYEVRYNVTGNSSLSAHFDVIPASNTNPQVPLGVSTRLNPTGTDAPAAGLTWDIRNNGGTTVATSSSPNGWQVAIGSHLQFTLTAPLTATVAANYEIRCHSTSNGNASAHFDLSGSLYSVVAGTKYVFMPNGARISFIAPSVPTAANPKVTCTVQAGAPLLVEWDYETNNSTDYYTITFPDRSKWVTTSYAKLVNGTAIVYLLQQQIDRNGNAIFFYYNSYGSTGFPLLSSITDSNNSALLSFNRTTNGTGNLTSVSDRYGRSIYYHVGTYPTANVPGGYPQSQQEVDHVSQVVATGTSNPPDRYAYGYLNYPNGEGSEMVPFLHTLTVPSPTGTGSSSATINYSNTGTGYVTSLVDANGNTRSYAVVDGTHTKVTVTDAQNNVVYSYTAGFDANMSETTHTDGAGTIIYAVTYADPNDPYRPSQVQDGNGYAVGGSGGKGTWKYTWDSFGNCQSMTTPRSTITTYSWSYTNFALGELTSMQAAGKQATTFTYYEPSGLLKTRNTPLPGTVNGTQNVTTTWTYDSLGNILTIVAPGNNAATTITTTFNYTTDGSYNQADAIGEPLTRTDNLGKITHLRYDSRHNTTSMVDALGNEIDAQYSLANQMTQITYPASGQTGTGRSYSLNGYLYPDGPLSSISAYDESNNLIRQSSAAYGLEGEMLSVSGSTEPVTVTYDGEYRFKTLVDGNGSVTHYYYATAGYLGGVTYPGYTGAAWPNLSGADSFQFTSFDNNGNLLTRVDGRGVTTNYVYNDVESRLTNLQYPATSSLNVSLGYDSYGRLNAKSDGAGSYSYSYDDLNALTNSQTTYTGLTAKTISYGFYPDGSIQTMTTPAGNFSYSYDGDERLSSLSNPYSESFSWTYLDNGWLWKQASNNSSGAQVVDAIATYNALGENTDLTNQNDTSHTVYSDWSSQVHDGVGNLTSMSVSMPAVTAYNGNNTYS